jgi:threonyl-tRNA synthetase
MPASEDQASSVSAPVVQATPKFAVLDYAGTSGSPAEPPPPPPFDAISAPPLEGETPPATLAEQADVSTSAAIAASSSNNNNDGGQGRRAMAGSGPRIANGKKIGGDCYTGRVKDPEWLKQRVSVYDAVKERRAVEWSSKRAVPIAVTMLDGTVLQNDKDGRPFLSYQTTPFQVAAVISQGLADAASVARVTYSCFCADYSLSEDGMDGVDTMSDAMNDDPLQEEEETSTNNNMTFLWDMTRPLVGTVSKIEFLKFEQDAAAKTVFWHSSAHMLGEALEHSFGNKLTIGPPLAGGFYYDSYMGTKDALTAEDCTFRLLPHSHHGNDIRVFLTSKYTTSLDSLVCFTDSTVEAEVNRIIKSKQKFERMVITKEEGLELFADNPFKVSILSTKVPDGTRTTVYRCGDLIDLCRGPHLPHTGKVKAFAATRHSAAHWLGDAENDSLQRMYGISFPDKKMLKVWQENQEKVCRGIGDCVVARYHDCVGAHIGFYSTKNSHDDKGRNLILRTFVFDDIIFPSADSTELLLFC